jgi:uncharacterized protein (TIGR02145 family)
MRFFEKNIVFACIFNQEKHTIARLIKILVAWLLLGFGTINAQSWNIGYPNAADVTATLSNDTFYIRGVGEMANFSSGAMYPWSSYIMNIKTVVIEDGVTSIGNAVFFYCINLTSIHIANSVTKIGYSAFNTCARITSITIPENVTDISAAFLGCFGLTSVTVLNPVPVIIAPNTFLIDSYMSAYPDTLYVPCGSRGAYEKIPEWGFVFRTILELCPPGVSNTQANFSCPGQVTVTYDLSAAQPVDVILYYSHNKRDWLIATTVTGDLTAQITGGGKTIIWDNSADNVRFGKFYFKVEVKPGPCAQMGGVMINGVCWATRNVGAPGKFVDNPEDAGMFYQWNRKTAWAATGTVTGWDSSASTGGSWKKDNDPSPAGWRVPTFEEIQKLFDSDKVSSEWDTKNGINGKRFTDIISGNSIFLPAVGFRDIFGSLNNNSAGSSGSYWSSSAYDEAVAYTVAYYLYFNIHTEDWWGAGISSFGFSVRPVAE